MKLTRQILYSSNFYQCLPEIYKQIGIFGFCAVGVEPDFDNVVNFRVLPIGSYYYAKNSSGKVDTFCRVYMETAKNIILYGEKLEIVFQAKYDKTIAAFLSFNVLSDGRSRVLIVIKDHNGNIINYHLSYLCKTKRLKKIYFKVL